MTDGHTRTAMRRWWSLAVCLAGLVIAPTMVAADAPVDAAAESPPSDAPTTSGDDSEEPSRPHRGLTNAPPFSVTISPMAHIRRLNLRAADGPAEHAPGLMGGIALDTSTLLLWDPDLQARAHLEVDASLARGRTAAYGGRSNAGHPLTTTFSSATARLAVSRRIVRHLRLSLAAGGSAFSWVLAPNSAYTGHRYITANVGMGLHLQMPGLPARLHGKLSGLPVIGVDVSGGQHGEGIGFGGRAELRGEWAPLAATDGDHPGRLLVHTSLSYTRFRSRFPASPLDPGGATSIDQSATLAVGVGYDL